MIKLKNIAPKFCFKSFLVFIKKIKEKNYRTWRVKAYLVKNTSKFNYFYLFLVWIFKQKNF